MQVVWGLITDDRQAWCPHHPLTALNHYSKIIFLEKINNERWPFQLKIILLR